jgi:hypothetical protein
MNLHPCPPPTSPFVSGSLASTNLARCSWRNCRRLLARPFLLIDCDRVRVQLSNAGVSTGHRCSCTKCSANNRAAIAGATSRTTGELRGAALELARAFAARIGVGLVNISMCDLVR